VIRISKNKRQQRLEGIVTEHSDIPFIDGVVGGSPAELYFWNFIKDEGDEVTERDTRAYTLIAKRLLEEFEKRGYGERDLFTVRLALEEAIMNCLKHAYSIEEGYKPPTGADGRELNNRTVSVMCYFEQEKATVWIIDDGRAFDPAEVPDPTLDENLEVTSGRGLLLMEAYMDRIEIHDRYAPPGRPQGTIIAMEKKRTKDPAA